MSLIALYAGKADRFQKRMRFNLYRAMKPKVIRWRGLKIATGDHMSQMCKDCLYWQVYEDGEVEIVSRFLQPDDVVFEIGTGLGAVALICSRKIGADRVHTYEANPGMKPHIDRNFELNNLFPESQICLLGEDERTGDADFFASSASFELSTAVKQTENTKATKTPTKSLNAELRRVNPTFLIVDIEGGEYDLFRVLDDFGRIKKVAIEVHPGVIGEEKVNAVRERLISDGFVIDPEYTQGQQLFAARP